MKSNFDAVQEYERQMNIST